MTVISSEYLLKPIQHWMNDRAVSEIVLNEPKKVFVERNDRFERHYVPEFTIKRLNQLFRLIANENYQILNEQKPLLSGVLRDGSRVQLVLPPVAKTHSFAIRIKKSKQFSLDDLEQSGYFKQTKNIQMQQDETFNKLREFYEKQQWYRFIRLALQARKNIVISGATSSGKTTFLNACLNELPTSERLIILEDTPEIMLKHENTLRLLADKGQQGLSHINMQDLLQCSLRLRPDRIIVGEVRGKEILDYIAASLTGHSGSITTIHAESTEIAFIRMCQMYKLNAIASMTDQDIYHEIKQAVDIIFQLKRTSSGRQLYSVYFKPLHRNVHEITPTTRAQMYVRLADFLSKKIS